MNININELNEIAQVITYGLRAFNPETMFFGKKTSAVFPNFNRYTVEFESMPKKVFGLQSVLECLAKSLGYNTYKGLLESGEQNFQLKKTALIGLNPNPLNIFYTDKWELFSVLLMSKILSGDNFSSNVLKNFKPTKLAQYLDFGISQIDLFLDYTPYQNIIGFEVGQHSIDEYTEEYFTVYSVAKAMESKAIEQLLKKYNCLDWFEGDEYQTDILTHVKKMQKLEKISMKFEDFLSVKAWDDTNYSKFINRLKLAFPNIYKGKIEFIGEGRSPMDKTVNFVFDKSVIETLVFDRITKKNVDNFKQACILLFNKYAKDGALYGNKSNENKTDELAYNGVHLKREYGLITEDDFTNMGTINYWINNSLFEIFKQVNNAEIGRSYTYRSEGASRLVSVSEYAEKIEEYISDKLFLKNNLVKLNFKTKKPVSQKLFEYKFKLQTNASLVETLIPNVVTVQSKFPLRYYLAEIYIQARLCEIVGMPLKNKEVGHPTTFYIDDENKYTVEIIETQSDAVANEVWEFDLLTSIQSLSLKFSDTHSDEVGDDDYVDLSQLKGVKKAVVNGEECFYLCKDEGDQISAFVSLTFIDTPYQFRKTQPIIFGNGELKILAVLNKNTSDLQLRYVGDDIDCPIIQPEFSLGLENCPYTQAIFNYLKDLDVFKELLSTFITTVHHKIQDGDTYVDTLEMNKEILPNEAVRQGQGLNTLIQGAKYNPLDLDFNSDDTASPNTPMQLDGDSSSKGLLVGHSVETGREVWLDYKDLVSNVAICGATGSGTTIVNDLLMNQQIRNGGGLLFIDPYSTQKKLDSVFESARLAGRENDVVIINFDNPESSKTYNPFLNTDAHEVSTRIMSIITNGKVQVVNNYYRKVGQQALEAIVAAFQCLGEVYSFEDLASVMIHEDKLKALESRLLKHHAEADATIQFQTLLSRYSLNQDFEMEAFKTSVGGVASRLMNLFEGALSSMMKTNTPEVNLEECILKNKIVYVLLPSMMETPQTVALSKLVMADCRSMMAKYQTYSVEDLPNPPFIIFASECSAYIDKNWSRMFEQARNSRTSMIATFQTPTSLQPAGDTTLSDVVMGNTKTKVFLKQASMESAIKVADEIGMKMDLKGKESHIVSPEQIMSIPLGECFVYAGGSQIDRVRLVQISD